MQYVYVLNKHGEPLMPCSPGKARLLLKQQKACVVKRTPFTIKLCTAVRDTNSPSLLVLMLAASMSACLHLQKSANSTAKSLLLATMW